MSCKGDVVVCALSGDYGKPRPALVVQSDLFNPTHASIIVCPITSYIIDASLFRILIYPSKDNGLTSLSQIMIDKLTAIKSEKIQTVIGKVEQHVISEVNDSLRLWLDL